MARRPKWAGRYAFDELSPGGPTTRDEAEWFPNLADLECRACGQTGRHTPGCPQETPYEETMMKLCKIAGCENEAAAERGAYALLCLAHREERVAAKTAGSAAVAAAKDKQILDDLFGVIESEDGKTNLVVLPDRTEYDDNGSLLVRLAMEVEKRRAELDDAVAALARQLEAIR